MTYILKDVMQDASLDLSPLAELLKVLKCLSHTAQLTLLNTFNSRVNNAWNSLPDSIVAASSVSRFKLAIVYGVLILTDFNRCL